MKIRFWRFRDPNSFPLPKPTVFEGKELDEIHERMRECIIRNVRIERQKAMKGGN